MRLISCHIENFGKLSDFSYEFSKGINVIFEDNGYGKSTLSSFLRVMLYGFDNETKKGELTRERTKYAPWQGGTYGGSLVLDIEGRRIILTRQFGKKESDDFFEVRDADTMLVTNEFGSNIGEQIFGIDSDSFKRSIMFSQNDCETGSTDGINAKLGNLTESTDDINNFEKVDEGLHKILNELTQGRKTGLRYKLKEDIYEAQAELRTRPVFEEEYHKKLELLEEEKGKIESLNTQREAIKDKKNQQALNRSFYVVKEQYERLIKEKYELENEINTIRKNNYLQENVLERGIPSEDSLLDINNKINMLKDLRSKKSGDEFSFNELADYNRLTAAFEGKANPIEDLDKALGLLDEYDELKQELVNLDSRKAAIGYKGDENTSKNKLVLGVSGLIIGGIFIIVSLILYTMKQGEIIIPVVMAVAGFMLLIISIIGITSYASERNVIKERLENYNALEERINEINVTVSEVKNQLLHILNEYSISYDKYEVGRRICRLRDDYDYFMRLCARKRNFDMNTDSIKITEYCEELNKFFEPFESVLSGEDFYDKFYSLRSLIKSHELYQEKKDRLSALALEVKNMEEAPDFLSVKAAYEPLETDENSDLVELEQINMRIEEANNNCLDYRKRIEELEELLDGLSDKKESLEKMQEEYDRLSKKAELIELTRNYLNEAKTAFVKKYSEPITNNFRKYFDILDGNNSSNYSFDANTNLNVYSEGKLRKPEAFSRGMRDLAGIAFRMSLTEAMYKSEKPYLIMDDPFVNLDDTRINGALKLIDNISKEYQVIYFTCSSSRVPNI